uniref:Putative ABC-type nitrate/sulfonate/bicarbonate transport systems periplasmic components-like protein n=1 Tax=uncultured bacterium 1114 TaxID=548901 RepID=B8R935_9BACT|nr:putative ABC-type nitrate/sulfonate/bicarbonate transport systems periplasmic components-like protein [uncultured bacterium 1114]
MTALTLLRRFAAMIVAFSAMNSSLAMAQDKKLEKMTLAVAADAFYYIPMYVAERGGFFREEGIEVDFVSVASGPRTMAAVAGGSVDATINDFGSTISAISKGSNHIVLSSEFNVATHTVVLSKAAIAKAGITPAMPIDEKVKRMKGMKIGVTAPGSGTDRFIRSVFVARGMKPDDNIQILALGEGNAILAAFEQGLADGFVYSAPIPQMAVAKGTGDIVFGAVSGDVPEFKDVPYVVFLTSKESLAAKPKVLEGAVRALTKAFKFIADKPAEAAAMTRHYFPAVDEAVFKASFEQHLGVGIPKSPIISQEQMTKTLALLNAGLPTPIKAELKEVFDDRFAQRAAKDILGR